MERVPGIDVSRWQGQMNWREVAAAGFRYAFIRATIGDAYTDPRFYANWDGAREAGLLVSAYHVIAPKVSGAAQMAAFFDVLDDRISDLPLVLDVEREDGVSATGITRCVKECLYEVEGRENRKPIIYTARWFWNRLVLPSPEWSAYDLWVASYTSEPLLPRDWQTWRFWQYSETGRVPGSGSRSTDLNWFAGSYDDLLAYAGKEREAPAEPVVLWRARVVIPKLNVRSGPGRRFKNIGDLYEGDVLEVLTLTGQDVWVEFEPGKWAAFTLGGDDDAPFMEVIPEIMPDQEAHDEEASEPEV
jgi:GH25 family lysozyme M1 (1,4-beta-N-acetylmuramidase)